MDRKALIAVVLLLLILVGAGLYYINTRQTAVSQAPIESLDPSSSPAEASSSSEDTSVKEFTVTGSNYQYEPATLTVNKGDKVKITFKSSGGMHDFVIDEFSVQSKRIGSGEQDIVEFIADKTGTFEYYCSVANHRAMGMKGTLTVN